MPRSSRSRRPRRTPPPRSKSPQAIAKAFGTERDTVRRWIDEGCPATPPPKGARGRGAAYRLNEDEVQAWTEARGLRLPGQRLPHNPQGGRPDGPAAGPGAGAGGDVGGAVALAWREEKVAAAKAKRELDELKLARARGEVMEREEHERQVLAAIDAVRATMLAAPRKYSMRFVALTEAEAREALMTVMREILDVFAGRLA